MSYANISAGKNPPQDINVIVEIPAHNLPIKYEVDKDTHALFVDRFMSAPMYYPANYGYLNNTLADDGDPIDVLVVTPHPVNPGCVVRARPIGILEMTDEAGKDSKILAVPHDKLTTIYKDVKEYTDLDDLLISQIKHFFEHYKKLENGKWVKVEQWLSREAAEQAIIEAVAAYTA
jgi:inorganic pyrophosphatase